MKCATAARGRRVAKRERHRLYREQSTMRGGHPPRGSELLNAATGPPAPGIAWVDRGRRTGARALPGVRGRAGSAGFGGGLRGRRLPDGSRRAARGRSGTDRVSVVRDSLGRSPGRLGVAAAAPRVGGRRGDRSRGGLGPAAAVSKRVRWRRPGRGKPAAAVSFGFRGRDGRRPGWLRLALDRSISSTAGTAGTGPSPAAPCTPEPATPSGAGRPRSRISRVDSGP